jgi:hypothetical protein
MNGNKIPTPRNKYFAGGSDLLFKTALELQMEYQDSKKNRNSCERKKVIGGRGFDYY